MKKQVELFLEELVLAPDNKYNHNWVAVPRIKKWLDDNLKDDDYDFLYDESGVYAISFANDESTVAFLLAMR
jgi:hypothetical protein